MNSRQVQPAFTVSSVLFEYMLMSCDVMNQQVKEIEQIVSAFLSSCSCSSLHHSEGPLVLQLLSSWPGYSRRCSQFMHAARMCKRS